MRAYEADFNQEHSQVCIFKVHLGGDSAEKPGAFVTEGFLCQNINLFLPFSLEPVAGMLGRPGEVDDRELGQTQKPGVDSIKPQVDEDCKTQEERKKREGVRRKTDFQKTG